MTRWDDMTTEEHVASSMRRYRVEQVIAAARALLERIDRTNAQRETRHGPNAPAREALREALAALDKEGG
jgi:hypothetical protein